MGFHIIGPIIEEMILQIKGKLESGLHFASAV